MIIQPKLTYVDAVDPAMFFSTGRALDDFFQCELKKLIHNLFVSLSFSMFLLSARRIIDRHDHIDCE